MSLSLQHECRDCKMKFESAAQLANHVKYFCTDSGYGTQADLQHKLAQLGVSENPQTVLSISDIKHYLRGDDQSKAPIAATVKNLSLDELRGHFQARQAHNEDLQRMVARKKEQDIISEVDHFKREREKLRLLKKQDEEVLLDLMQEMEKKKERELRADIEKEQIRKALKDVQRQKLTELSKDKKRELERLAGERESLRLKESQIMDQIKSLEGNLKEQQRKLDNDRQALKEKRGIGAPSLVNEWQDKQIEFAKERGEKVANLKQKREILEAERERIMGQLESVKQGDLSHLKQGGELSRWLGKEILRGSQSSQVLGENMQGLDARQKEQLIKEQVKINKLREELQNIKKAKLPEVDELDALKKQLEENSFQTRLDEYMQRVDNRIKDDREKMMQYKTIRQDLEDRGTGEKLNMPELPAAPSTNPAVRFQDHSQDSIQKPLTPYSEKQSKKDKSKKKKKKRRGSSSSEESERGFYRSHSNKRLGRGYEPPIPPYYDPYGRAPSLYPGALAPPQFTQQPIQSQGNLQQPQDNTQTKLLEQQTQHLKEQQNFMHKQTSDMYNKQMDQMQKIIERQELEKSKLADQIEDIRRMQQSQLSQNNKLPDSLLQQLKPRTPQPPPQPVGYGSQQMHPQTAPEIVPVFQEKPHFAQNDERAKDLDQEERALMNLQAQEYDSLMLLSKLNPESDLYKHKYQQFLKMSEWRTKAEQALQEQRLMKIKESYGFQKIQVEKKIEEDRLLEGARREMILRQLKGGADMQQAQYNVTTQLQQSSKIMDNPGGMAYNPKQGFYILWDFIIGHPSSFEAMKATYTITSRRINSPEFIDLPLTYASPGATTQQKNTIFGIQKNPTNIEADMSALLIVQVQGQRLSTPGGGQGLLMPIGWSMLDLFTGGRLKVGAWKLPLYLGTPEMSFDVRRVKELQQEASKMMCHFRIVSTLVDPLAVSKMTPEMNAGEYALPQIHSPGVSNLAQIIAQGGPVGAEPNFSGKYSVEGVNVFLHQLKNYPGQLGRDISVEVELRLGTEIMNDQQNKPCVWRSKSFPSVPGGTLAPITGNSGPTSAAAKVNRMFSRGSVGLVPPSRTSSRIKTVERKLPIMQEISFFQDLYKMVWQAKFASHIYLIVKVYEGQELLCFGCHRLDEQGTGQINLGPVDMDMCVPPVQVYEQPRPDHISRFPYIMRVTIGKPVRRSHQNQQEQQKEESKQKVGSRAISRSLLSEDGINYSKYRPAFMYNPDLNYTDELFMKDDGIDIYIPELRFPPDSSSLCKLNTTIIDEYENSLLDTTVKGVGDINTSSTMKNIFGFRTEIRNGNLSPLTYLYVAVEVINQVTESREILGYAYLPLFINSFDKRPCSDPTQRDFILLEGCYQVPLYAKRVNEEEPEPLDISKLNREPITSLLVVIRKAPRDKDRNVLSISNYPEEQWQDKGIIIKTPEYETGQYSTFFFKPSIGELEGMMVKFSQNKLPLKEILARMLDISRGRSGTAKAADFQDSQIETWAQDILDQGDLTQGTYIFNTPYQEHVGLSFAIERLINVNEKFFWGMVFTIFPPGKFFLDPKIIEEKWVGLTSNLVWESPARAPIFDSPLKNFRNLAKDVDNSKYDLNLLSDTGVPVNMFVVIELRQILAKTEEKRWEVAGYSIVPLFSRHKYLGDNRIYVNTGVYQVPVLKGKILRSQLAMLENEENPLQYAINCAEKKRNNFQFYENTSIQVILVDGHIKRVHSFMGMIGFLGDIRNKKALEKYEYNPAKIKQKMTCETIIPRKAKKEAIKEGYVNVMNLALEK